LFLNDIVQVIYSPKKAFKKILAEPKYLGVILIFILFVGLQIGYEYAQFSKVQVETTSPAPGMMQENNNATNWVSGDNVILTNNFDDYYNNSVYVASFFASYSLFGNNSLQVEANDTDTVTLALSNTSNVDCTANGFQNLSLTMKLVEPQHVPSNAILTLYSINDNDFYTYDFTSALQNANAVNQWGNLTIPLGPEADGWTETGIPSWQNITSLTLQLTYADSQDITIHIGALFFRGQYIHLLQDNLFDFLGTFTIEFTMQFLVTWLVLTAMIWLILKGLKRPVTWKPIFVAAGFAMVVMVIRALVNLVVATTLSPMYYPFDAAYGVVYNIFGALSYPPTVVLPVAESAAAINSITTSMTVFNAILTAMFIVSYVWLAALVAVVVKEAKPEFSTFKAIIVGGASVVATILILLLLVVLRVIGFI